MYLISTVVSSFVCLLSYVSVLLSSSLFFFNDPATTEIYTLSLHDALPISQAADFPTLDINIDRERAGQFGLTMADGHGTRPVRSEEHTSELQSHSDLVCRLLLEKKKKKKKRKKQTHN